MAVVAPQIVESPYSRAFSIGTSASPDHVLEGTYGGFLVPSNFRDEILMVARMEMDIAIRHSDSFVLISEGE